MRRAEYRASAVPGEGDTGVEGARLLALRAHPVTVERPGQARGIGASLSPNTSTTLSSGTDCGADSDGGRIRTSARHDGHVARVDWPEALAVAVVLAMFAVAGGAMIARGAPFGFDEAVYGLRLRDITEGGIRGFYWATVRAPGLPILLAPTAWLGATDQAIRAGALAFAVAGIGLTWLEARLLFDRATAITAAVLLALSPGWLESAWQTLPDIPGTTLVLAAVVVLTLATRHDRMRWWAVAVAPIAAVATAVRYGTPLLLGPALVAVMAVRWRVAIRSPVVLTLTTLLTAGAVAAVWLIPQVTGSMRPPVLIFLGRQVAKAVPMLDSALDFASKIPVLVGPIVGAAFVVGIVAALVAARRRQVAAAPVIACLAVAVTCFGLLLVGVAVYSLRYLTPALPFLAIAAGAGLAWAGARVPGRTVVTVAAVAAVAGGALVAFRTAEVSVQRLEHRYGPTRTAAVDLATVAPDSCYVLSPLPQQTQWYSRCGASYIPVLPIGDGRTHQTGISDPQLMADRLRGLFRTRLAAHGILEDAPVYVMLKRGSRARPRGEARALLVDLARWQAAAADGRRPVTIWYLGSAGELAERVETITPPGEYQ